MNWSDFKEMEKGIVKDKNFSVVEKVFTSVFVAPTVFGIGKADEALKNITGKGLIDRVTKLRMAEEEEKKKHPWKWAGKKVLKGTLFGIIGGYSHKP